MADSKYERYIRNFPNVFRPINAADVNAGDWLSQVPNPIINALLLGLSEADQDVAMAIQEAKAQLFVKTASTQYLDVIASSLGVARPALLGLPDDAFRQLVPPLSLRAKQVRQAFYNAMDAFWGPEFSRANIDTSDVDSTYDLIIGDELRFAIDNGNTQIIVVQDGDIENQGAASILELNNLLVDKLNGISTDIITDPISKLRSIRLRTNTPGLLGAIEYSETRGRENITPIFPVGKIEILNQDQRTAVYEINPNEVIIEIPAVVPSLARGLRGSLHLHKDSVINRIENKISIFNYVLPEGLFDNDNSDYTVPIPDIVPEDPQSAIQFTEIDDWEEQTYTENSIVFYENNLYRATIDVPGDEITFTPDRSDATAWRLVVPGEGLFFNYNEDNRNLLIGTDSRVATQVLEIIVEDANSGDSTILYLRLVDDVESVDNADFWQGAFLFDPSGSGSNFTVSGQSAIIVGDATISDSTSLTAGEVHPRIQVDPGTNTLPEEPGFAVIGFGSNTEEAALIRYRGRASDAVIEIDPSFIFTNTHTQGTFINIVSAASPFVADKVGGDYPIYMTSSTSARETILEILRSLSAAGVILNFVILAPDYKYLIDNPYLTTDSSPNDGDVGIEDGYKYLIDNPTIPGDGAPSS